MLGVHGINSRGWVEKPNKLTGSIVAFNLVPFRLTILLIEFVFRVKVSPIENAQIVHT